MPLVALVAAETQALSRRTKVAAFDGAPGGTLGGTGSANPRLEPLLVYANGSLGPNASVTSTAR